MDVWTTLLLRAGDTRTSSQRLAVPQRQPSQFLRGTREYVCIRQCFSPLATPEKERVQPASYARSQTQCYVWR